MTHPIDQCYQCSSPLPQEPYKYCFCNDLCHKAYVANNSTLYEPRSKLPISEMQRRLRAWGAEIKQQKQQSLLTQKEIYDILNEDLPF